MPVMVVQDEKRIDDVARRVLRGRLSGAASARARAAIRAANPGLDFDRLRRGDVVVVPSIDEARPSFGDVVGSAVDPAIELVAGALDGLATSGAAAAETAGAEREEIRQQLAEIRKLGRGRPEVAETVKALASFLNDADKAAEAQAARRDDAVPRWKEQLATLRDLGG